MIDAGGLPPWSSLVRQRLSNAAAERGSRACRGVASRNGVRKWKRVDVDVDADADVDERVKVRPHRQYCSSETACE